MIGSNLRQVHQASIRLTTYYFPQHHSGSGKVGHNTPKPMGTSNRVQHCLKNSHIKQDPEITPSEAVPQSTKTEAG